MAPGISPLTTILLLHNKHVIIQCAPIIDILMLIACGSMGLYTMSELTPAPNEHKLKLFGHLKKIIFL